MSRILTLLLTASLLLSGCTGSAKHDPVTPGDSSTSLQVMQSYNPGNRSLLGLYNVVISVADGVAEIVPARNSVVHLNIVKFLEKDPCTTCLGIDSVEMHTPTELWA